MSERSKARVVSASSYSGLIENTQQPGRRSSRIRIRHKAQEFHRASSQDKKRICPAAIGMYLNQCYLDQAALAVSSITAFVTRARRISGIYPRAKLQFMSIHHKAPEQFLI